MLKVCDNTGMHSTVPDMVNNIYFLMISEAGTAIFFANSCNAYLRGIDVLYNGL